MCLRGQYFSFIKICRSGSVGHDTTMSVFTFILSRKRVHCTALCSLHFTLFQITSLRPTLKQEISTLLWVAEIIFRFFSTHEYTPFNLFSQLVRLNERNHGTVCVCRSFLFVATLIGILIPPLLPAAAAASLVPRLKCCSSIQTTPSSWHVRTTDKFSFDAATVSIQ